MSPVDGLRHGVSPGATLGDGRNALLAIDLPKFSAQTAIARLSERGLHLTASAQPGFLACTLRASA